MWLQKLTVFSYSVILLFLIIILYTIVVFSVPSLWSLWLYGFVCIHDTAWPVHFNIASLRQSPIFFAPSRQVCKLLIFRQADIELANAKKQTPLHLAAHAGLHQAAACLLETFQSSALDLKDTCGHSPLLYAAKSKVKSIHAFLEGFRTAAQPEHVAEATHSVEGEQQVSVPPVDLEKAELESEEVALQTPQTKCPEGHGLIPFESETDNFVCSVCECEFPMGTVLYGCRNCDYDLCRECLAHTVFHAGGKDFSVALPEMPATFEAVDNNTNVGPGQGNLLSWQKKQWWKTSHARFDLPPIVELHV